MIPDNYECDGQMNIDDLERSVGKMNEAEAKAIIEEIATEYAENGEEKKCEAFDLAIKTLEEAPKLREQVELLKNQLKNIKYELE